jgi:hypothetical protein
MIASPEVQWSIMLAFEANDRSMNHLGATDHLCSCGVAANHEALSRLRLGFESRQEHAIHYHG